MAASGANLGSIGYHYGSTEALLNAAVLAAIEEWGAQLAAAMADGIDPAAPFPERFARYWTAVTRLAWARLLHGIDPEAEPEKARAVGSVHQALLSGILVQWLADPERAPSAADLGSGLRAISEAMSG